MFAAMRTLSLVLFTLFIALASSAAPQVEVAEAITTIAPTTARMYEWCGADGDFDACTRFVAFRLNTRCTGDGLGWRLEAAATFRPFIVLRNIHRVAHEQLHIADVRASTGRYVTALESWRFDSAEECEAASAAARDAFPGTLRRLALQSNTARHPGLAAAMRTR